MCSCRFSELQKQATLALRLVPVYAVQENNLSTDDLMDGHYDDLVTPGSLDTELHSWIVSISSTGIKVNQLKLNF